MAGAKLTPLAAALGEVGLRLTGFDHRRTFVRNRMAQLYVASFEGSLNGVPPAQRKLVPVAAPKKED